MVILPLSAVKGGETRVSVGKVTERGGAKQRQQVECRDGFAEMCRALSTQYSVRSKEDLGCLRTVYWVLSTGCWIRCRTRGGAWPAATASGRRCSSASG